jgi:hypothetical protein
MRTLLSLLACLVFLALVAPQTAAQSAPLALWEYQRVDASDLQTLGKGSVEQGLNLQGQEGWELVGVTSTAEGRLGFAFFKRPKAPAFVIRQVRTDAGERIVIRLNPLTGESWSNRTTGGTDWTKIAEPEAQLPLGNYDVLLLPGRDKDTFWTLRYDRVTGKTWSWTSDGWAAFVEPEM